MAKKRKRKWKDFCIIAVKLNPEQAVLACCDQAYGRTKISSSYCCTSNCPAIPYAATNS